MAEQEEQAQKFRPLEELSYEQSRDELIEIVRILELGNMSLDESLHYWERGEALAAACDSYLDGASKTIDKALESRNHGTEDKSTE